MTFCVIVIGMCGVAHEHLAERLDAAGLEHPGHEGRDDAPVVGQCRLAVVDDDACLGDEVVRHLGSLGAERAHGDDEGAVTHPGRLEHGRRRRRAHRDDVGVRARLLDRVDEFHVGCALGPRRMPARDQLVGTRAVARREPDATHRVLTADRAQRVRVRLGLHAAPDDRDMNTDAVPGTDTCAVGHTDVVAPARVRRPQRLHRDGARCRRAACRQRRAGHDARRHTCRRVEHRDERVHRGQPRADVAGVYRTELADGRCARLGPRGVAERDVVAAPRQQQTCGQQRLSASERDERRVLRGVRDVCRERCPDVGFAEVEQSRHGGSFAGSRECDGAVAVGGARGATYSRGHE